jgi:glycosyltransferase involved in cell wall biosynthesis
MSVKNISVVIATFNGSKYIIKQLNSILNQTILPDEIIVCDDNSTDDTVFLLTPYLSDGKIKLMVNEKRLGVVENFKKAAKAAKYGNWLAFADQDDIWVPQKLSKLGAAMELLDDKTTPALVYSDLTVIDKNDALISSSFWERQKIKPEKINLATILYGNVVTGCTMIINYSMAKEFFLMNDQNYFHDEWMGLIAYSFGVAKILNEPLVLYRQHENNITFSEDYKTPGFKDGLIANMNYLFRKKKFLSRQFNVAKAFLLAYQNKLDDNQRSIFENFIRQENKNYILQRLNRRIAYL